MKTSCPNCGAEVEFRYDDSFVRICDHCKSAVLRTDRGLETLGKVGDLAPLDSPLKLFAEGHAGSSTFLLVGMAQLRHSAGGVWQEWYTKDGGTWGWLAEAQGRYYLTYEIAEIAAPSWQSLSAGVTVSLAGKTFTVGELGTATYISARGEIPYRLQPDETFRFADLSDGQGAFATIDYGSEDDEPRVFMGTQVSLEQLQISGGEEEPAGAPRITSAKLACPNCNGALELRAPDITLRVACPFCDHLVSVETGNLQVIERLAKKPILAIPLGTKGTFSEGELTVIGYVERSAKIENSWYAFEEYLLYRRELGFRWLVCSDGHWSYVQPIASGAVEPIGPKYDGVTFEQFQNAPLRVDTVYGELYWRVLTNEMVSSQDYVAPPAMLSVEQTRNEQNWSLSTYLTAKQMKAAFPNIELNLPVKIGIAPNQPYGAHGWQLPMYIGFALLCAVGIYKCNSAKNTVQSSQNITVPPGAPKPAPATTPGATPDPAAAESGNVAFSEPFHLDGGKDIEVTLSTGNLSNSWLYAAVDLVNDKTGDVVSFDTNLEYYSGFEDGESWSEGDRTTGQFISPLPAGDYVMRVEAQHGQVTPVTIGVSVMQDVFKISYFFIALGVLAVPLGIMLLHARGFRRRQWENSNLGGSSSWDDDDDDD